MAATATAEIRDTGVLTSDTTTVEDPFSIDLRVITDIPPTHPLAACKGGTDDGCDPTCASACVSGGV